MLLKPSEMMRVDTEEYVLDLAIHPDEIDESEAVDIELNLGDVSIHNPFIIHGSNANVSLSFELCRPLLDSISPGSQALRNFLALDDAR